MMPRPATVTTAATVVFEHAQTKFHGGLTISCWFGSRCRGGHGCAEDIVTDAQQQVNY
jgi:hypothetical protein